MKEILLSERGRRFGDALVAAKAALVADRPDLDDETLTLVLDWFQAGYEQGESPAEPMGEGAERPATSSHPSDRAPAAPGADLLEALAEASMQVHELKGHRAHFAWDACALGYCPEWRALIDAARPAPPPDAGAMEAAYGRWSVYPWSGNAPLCVAFAAGWAAARREGGG